MLRIFFIMTSRMRLNNLLLELTNLSVVHIDEKAKPRLNEFAHIAFMEKYVSNNVSQTRSPPLALCHCRSLLMPESVIVPCSIAVLSVRGKPCSDA